MASRVFALLRAARQAGAGAAVVALGVGTSTAGLVSWGGAQYGELGHGIEAISGVPSPHPVGGLTGVTRVASSGTAVSSAALTVDGAVYTWGCGKDDRLGYHNGNSNQLVPRRVDGLPGGITAIALGEFHGAAVTAAGRVWTWGKRAAGRATPDVAELGGPLATVTVSSVACGREHTLAVTREGEVWGWGSNSTHALGTGDKSPLTAPARVKIPEGGALSTPRPRLSAPRLPCLCPPPSVRMPAPDLPHTTPPLHAAHAPSCRPAMVRHPVLKVLPVHSAPPPFLLLLPTYPPPLAVVVAAAAGREHSLLLTGSGQVWAAGSDSYGQCAAGGVPAVKTWTKVGGPLTGRKVTAIAAGEYHSVALCDDGAVFVWGFNRDGTLGLGDRSDVVSPRPLPLAETLSAGGVRIVQVACGGGHTLFRTSDGRLWAVGRGRSGQLGRSGGLESVAAYRTDVVEVLGLSTGGASGKVVDVAAGRDHSLALVA